MKTLELQSADVIGAATTYVVLQFPVAILDAHTLRRLPLYVAEMSMSIVALRCQSSLCLLPPRNERPNSVETVAPPMHTKIPCPTKYMHFTIKFKILRSEITTTSSFIVPVNYLRMDFGTRGYFAFHD